MPVFNVGDKVTLKGSVGGWVGYVAAIAGGPTPIYTVVSAQAPDSLDYGAVHVQGADIEEGTLPNPTFTLGQTVALYGFGGTITNIDGRTLTVEINIERCHYTLERVHVVPDWLLALYNPS